jgi:hypothetical protein
MPSLFCGGRASGLVFLAAVLVRHRDVVVWFANSVSIADGLSKILNAIERLPSSLLDGVEESEQPPRPRISDHAHHNHTSRLIRQVPRSTHE